MVKIELDNSITSDDVLGKEVIDVEGEFIGVAEKLHIDPTLVEIVGISIDKGFLKKGLIVGKDYIDRVTPHAIFLKISPSYKLKGMIVFDSEGKKIGNVIQIELNNSTNRVKNLLVRTGVSKKVFIDAGYIDRVGENIILNEKEENLNFG